MEDLEQLRRIGYETYEAAFRQLNTPANMQAYLEHAFEPAHIAAQLANSQSEFFFLNVDEQLAGYLKINEFEAQTDLQEAHGLEIERIYVVKEFQGQGLGGQLLQKALAVARAKGKAYAWLSVWQKNPRAIEFYRKMGFQPAGTRIFVMGDEEQHDYIMRLELSVQRA